MSVQTRLRAMARWLGLVLLGTTAVSLAALQPIPAHAGIRYKLVPVATGLNQPVYVAMPPNDSHRLFIVEKVGVIRVVRNGRLLASPFLDISSKVSTDGERGLLSMAFDPGYATNRQYYVYYTDLSGTIVIARYVTLANDPDHSGSAARVFVAIPHATYNNHNGGQLQFDPVAARSGQAWLYFGTGDGGSRGDPTNNAQNLRSGLGKLFRINVHAAKPKRLLYAYGLRNPWRFSFDRRKGDLRIGDVGQNRWEELDYIKSGSLPGKNFGWRKYEGNHLYHNQQIDGRQLTWPFWEYSHGGGNCAVVGGYMYRGNVPGLYAKYLYGDLCTGNIWAQKPYAGPIRLNISGQVSSLVSFGEGNSGEVYVVSINGSVWRLSA
jgi:glucose/arabinose dehydrogenase